MKITEDDKSLIRENLIYVPATGSLLWRDESQYRPFIGSPPVQKNESGCGKTEMTVSIGDKVFKAEEVCWFLWKRRIPRHGVIFSDKSKAGRMDLRSSNLRLRRRPEYVKKGRAVWVSRGLAERLVDCLVFHGEGVLAEEMLGIMKKDYKR